MFGNHETTYEPRMIDFNKKTLFYFMRKLLLFNIYMHFFKETKA